MKSLPLTVATLVLTLCCGCGGLAVSKGISPLDFFLPGLLQNEPRTPTTPVGPNAASQFALTPQALAPEFASAPGVAWEPLGPSSQATASLPRPDGADCLAFLSKH